MTSEMGELFNDIKEDRRRKKQANLKKNETELLDASWTVHSEVHWSKSVVIEGRFTRVEFWPSGNKWKVGNKYYRGSLPKVLKEIIHARSEV